MATICIEGGNYSNLVSTVYIKRGSYSNFVPTSSNGVLGVRIDTRNPHTDNESGFGKGRLPFGSKLVDRQTALRYSRFEWGLNNMVHAIICLHHLPKDIGHLFLDTH